MTKAKRTNGKFSEAKYFHNQEFFQDFNWEVFQKGDIVWLEDYPGTVKRICGIFIGIDHEDAAVIRLIPNRDGAILARNESENILGYSDYWKRYL